MILSAMLVPAMMLVLVLALSGYEDKMFRPAHAPADAGAHPGTS